MKTFTNIQLLDVRVRMAKDRRGDDWKRRLGDDASRSSDVTQLTPTDCQLLIGTAFGRSDAFDDGDITIEDVQRCFPPFVLRHLQTLSGMPRGFEGKTSVWVGRTPRSFAGCDRVVLCFLRVLLTSGSSRDQFVCFTNAIRVPVTTEGGTDRSSVRGAHRVSIGRGSFKQCLLREEPHSKPSGRVTLLHPDTSSGSRSFWVVESLFGLSDGTNVYAHVRRMRRTSDSACFEPIFEADSSPTRQFVLHLSGETRKVLGLHKCQSGSNSSACTYDADTGKLSHYTIGTGFSWTLLGTQEGFPPRRR